MHLRHELKPGDLGWVVSLHGTVYSREHGWDHTFEGYVAEGIGRFATSFDPTNERIWIAEINQELAGCVAIVRRDHSVAQLRWFLVHIVARGRGLGRMLLRHAIAFARSSGYQTIVLETVAGLNAAAELYRQAGFGLIRGSFCSTVGRNAKRTSIRATFVNSGRRLTCCCCWRAGNDSWTGAWKRHRKY